MRIEPNPNYTGNNQEEIKWLKVRMHQLEKKLREMEKKLGPTEETHPDGRKVIYYTDKEGAKKKGVVTLEDKSKYFVQEITLPGEVKKVVVDKATMRVKWEGES